MRNANHLADSVVASKMLLNELATGVTLDTSALVLMVVKVSFVKVTKVPSLIAT